MDTLAPQSAKSAKGSRLPAGNGVVLVLVVLSLVVAALIAYYVLSVSHKARSRDLTQYTATNASQAGAAWIARTLNVTAMNNLRSAQYIAMTNLVDAMPKAIEFGIADYQAFEAPINEILENGQVPASWDAKSQTSSKRTIHGAVQVQLRNLEQQLKFLKRYHKQFNDPDSSAYRDVRELTHYQTPSGKRGRLWTAAQMLQNLSSTALQNVGSLAQINAMHAGSIRVSDATSRLDAVLVPVVASLDWKQVHFDQYQGPITHGRDIPLVYNNTNDIYEDLGEIDDSDWRQYGRWRGAENSRKLVVKAARGGVPLDNGVAPQNEKQGHRNQTAAQTNHGIHDLLVMSHRMSSSEVFGNRRLTFWTDTIGKIKLNYLWPQSKAPATVVKPKWITDVDQALAIADKNPDSIHQTAWLRVQIRSRYPADHPKFMNDDSWTFVRDGRTLQLRIELIDGWSAKTDPRQWEKKETVTRLNQRIWRDKWTYQSYQDRDIRLRRVFDKKNKPKAQDVYRIDDYILIGINVGKPETVRNPHNFKSRETLPGPIILTNAGDNADSHRALEVTAIARHYEESFLWANPMRRGEPDFVAMYTTGVRNEIAYSLWSRSWETTNSTAGDPVRWAATGRDQIDLFDNFSPLFSSSDAKNLFEQIDQLGVVAEEMQQ